MHPDLRVMVTKWLLIIVGAVGFYFAGQDTAAAVDDSDQVNVVLLGDSYAAGNGAGD